MLKEREAWAATFISPFLAYLSGVDARVHFGNREEGGCVSSPDHLPEIRDKIKRCIVGSPAKDSFTVRLSWLTSLLTENTQYIIVKLHSYSK